MLQTHFFLTHTDFTDVWVLFCFERFLGSPVGPEMSPERCRSDKVVCKHAGIGTCSEYPRPESGGEMQVVCSRPSNQSIQFALLAGPSTMGQI